MKKRYQQWLIGLGVAGSGSFSSLLPLAQKNCTGLCGSCTGLCIPGLLVGSGLMVSCLYKRLAGWKANKQGRVSR